MSTSVTKQQIIEMLRIIYWSALKDKKWYAAIRAAELQGKAIGMFERQRLPAITRIEDMDEYQLRSFIEILERNDPSLKEDAPLKEDAGDPKINSISSSPGQSIPSVECLDTNSSTNGATNPNGFHAANSEKDCSGELAPKLLGTALSPPLDASDVTARLDALARKLPRNRDPYGGSPIRIISIDEPYHGNPSFTRNLSERSPFDMDHPPPSPYLFY